MFSDVYGTKPDSRFINTLEDCIHEREEMSHPVNNCVQVERSKRVLELTRALCINNWNSEPRQRHQNHAKRRSQIVKCMTNTLLDRYIISVHMVTSHNICMFRH